MKARLFVIVVLIPLVAACAIGPRYRPPRVALPAAWTEAPPPDARAQGASALEQWWTTFRDPVLDGLVARAINGNLDLQIAATRVREARAARGIAESAALPQLDANGQYVRFERSDAVPPFESAAGGSSPFGARTQNVFEAGFDARWEIDVFGGVRRDVEAAVAQVQAAEEGRRDVLVALLGEVARNYTELRGTQRQLEILDATVRSQQDTLDIARARFEAGLGTALDVERAEGLLAATTSRRPELERLARRSMFRLGVLLGKNVTALVSELENARPLPPRPPELPIALPSELLSRRPDLRRAEREVAVATARIGVARADLFPRFSITGSFGRRSDDAADLGSGTSQFWFLVPGVRWPILSGGRIRANIRVQNARQEQAVLQYEQAILTAVEDVENALAAQTREQRRLESLQGSVDANRRAFELATDRYTSGLEAFLSVLDAQRALYAAEDALAQSETSAVVSLIAVYKALGGGWTPDESIPPPTLREGAVK